MIDEKAIEKALLELQIEPDENGLISAFGVYLTRLFGDYYNRICCDFMDEFTKEVNNPEVIAAAQNLLIEAGHVCGFNTFGGIMTSAEWEAIVEPMIETTEDWIYGMVAVINSALGWGKWEVVELLPNEKLVIRTENDFECDFYLRTRKTTAKSGQCYLMIGTTAALMNLVYYGKIMEKPTLDEALYKKLFHNPSGFYGKEVKCRCMGDPYCEIVVEKR